VAETAPSQTGDAAGDALGAALIPLLDRSFVLTDREGGVTRWTARAEALFGWGAARVAGKPLLETLGSKDTAPPSAGRVETIVRHQGGREFPSAFMFIPVPMTHSLEFNGLLEALESDRPRDAIVQRIRSHYGPVLDWIAAAASGTPWRRQISTAAITSSTVRGTTTPIGTWR
jgi:PAS domain-containing protein